VTNLIPCRAATHTRGEPPRCARAGRVCADQLMVISDWLYLIMYPTWHGAVAILCSAACLHWAEDEPTLWCGYN